MAHYQHYDDPQYAPVAGAAGQQVTYAPHPAHAPHAAPQAAYPAHAGHAGHPRMAAAAPGHGGHADGADPYGAQDPYGTYPTHGAAPGAADPAGGSRFGAAVNWAGALVSLGLVVGMGVWAWQLTVRDVSGVPVIRALEGPMRVAPTDPGGAQADHQGLAVNRIAEGAEAAPVPDRLVLAPPPVELEDIAVATTATTGAAAGEASPQTQALIDRLLSQGGELEAAPATQATTLASNVEPTLEQTVAAPVVSDAVIPASVPGVARSLRPLVRPASLQTASSSLGSAPAAPAPQGNELSLSDLAQGTRLVQLGAFDSADLARAEWRRLAGVFPDFFNDRARVIQQASSGGQEFFRLRAHGFDDLAESRRFCAALVAQGVGCIPVSVR